MDILYLLVPLALVLAALIVWALLWAIRSGQFDDLEGPAHTILWDEDDSTRPEPDGKGTPPKRAKGRAPGEN